MRWFNAALLPLSLVFAAPLSAAEVTNFTLENGMEVVILEEVVQVVQTMVSQSMREEVWSASSRAVHEVCERERWLH